LQGVADLAKTAQLGDRVELSDDGRSFAAPARFPPEVRDLIPKERWGGPPVLAPGRAAPAASARAAPPAPAPPPPAPMGDAEVTVSAAVAAGLPFEGSLEEASPLHLYYLAAASQAGGRLTIDPGGGFTYALIFKKGTVEHVTSTAPDDDLAKHLIQRGVVTAEQVRDAEVARSGFGGELVGALIGMKLMNATESYDALLAYATALAAKALAVDGGKYRWEPGVTPPPSAFPVGSRWGLLCDAARRLDPLTVRRRLGDRINGTVIRSGGRVQMADLKLSPQEARTHGLFDGVHSVVQLAAGHPAESDIIHRLALLFGETELVRFGPPPAEEAPPPQAEAAPPEPETKPEPAAKADPATKAEAAPKSEPVPAEKEPAAEKGPAAAPAKAEKPPAAAAKPAAVMPSAAAKPVAATPSAAAKPAPAAAPKVAAPAKPAAPKPAPAKPAAPAAAAAPAKPPPKLDLAFLQETFQRISSANHFDVLGVKQEADTGKIKIAYFQLAKIYHPDTALPDATPEAKKLQADIFAKLGEAWGVLGDDAKRAAYVKELQSGGSANIDVLNILHAEQSFLRGSALVKTRKYQEALAAFNEAIGLNPDEAEFGIWKIWAEFLISPDKKGAQPSAAAAIESSLKRNPRCIPGYLFLGQMAKLAGEADAAERHWKRGLGIEPNNQELQRELKYLKK
jgi:tetratricopeptide (TPR) repeat protein